MPGIDLDEHVRCVVHGSSDEVREPEQRRQNGACIGRFRDGKPRQFADAPATFAELCDHRIVRLFRQQPMRAIEAQRHRANRLRPVVDDECHLLGSTLHDGCVPFAVHAITAPGVAAADKVECSGDFDRGLGYCEAQLCRCGGETRGRVERELWCIRSDYAPTATTHQRFVAIAHARDHGNSYQQRIADVGCIHCRSSFPTEPRPDDWSCYGAGIGVPPADDLQRASLRHGMFVVR
jgi:hypothetical protein